MLTERILLCGPEEPTPRLELHAGALTALFEAGGLRYIRYGGLEVLRGVYSALRDRNWGTVLPRLSPARLRHHAHGLEIEFEAIYQEGEIDFAARYRLEFHANGFSFGFIGQARRGFYRNRLGFCVLHPMSAAGAACRIEHGDGSVDEARFPLHIAAEQPVPPFSEIRAMEHQVAPDLWARLEFFGDLFDTEDQRNWGDASFKTFCTPLRMPFPVRLEAGERVEQRVELRLRGSPPAPGIQVAEKTLQLGSSRSRVPFLGTEVASHDRSLSPGEIQRLRALGLSHLRVSLDCAEPFGERLRRAVEQSRQLGLGLEVAVRTAEPPEGALEALASALSQDRAEVVRLLVYPYRVREAEHRPYLEAARKALGGLGKPIFGGTDADFFFLNTYPVPPEAVDGLAFALNPQVHAFDDTSLVETLETQTLMVQEARRLSCERPVVVSPLTFKPRWNPYATAAPPPTPPGELPPQVDPRQLSLFGATWTMGSLVALSLGGAGAVTLFETTGWRGLMETEVGSPLPELFPSPPGAVFPLYHVVADFAEFQGGEVVGVTSSHPMELGGIVLCHGDRGCLLVANYTGSPQTVKLEGFPPIARVRELSGSNARRAMTEPERWRQEWNAPTFPVDLPPYAYMRFELGGPL